MGPTTLLLHLLHIVHSDHIVLEQVRPQCATFTLDTLPVSVKDLLESVGVDSGNVAAPTRAHHRRPIIVLVLSGGL